MDEPTDNEVSLLDQLAELLRIIETASFMRANYRFLSPRELELLGEIEVLTAGPRVKTAWLS